MRRLRGLVIVVVALAGCAAEPDALLVVAQPGVVDPTQPATIDVYVGVDRGLVMAPLTATRPLVVNALPDDLDRTWADPSQPYTIRLDPAGFTDELYVVLRIDQPDHRYGGDLRAPVTYPGAGLYSVEAELFAGGGRTVCPNGLADDAHYVVELLPSDPADPASFDCDLDGSPYPQDCVDFDPSIHPAPAYPPSTGQAAPEIMQCCNGADRAPMELVVDPSGPSGCSLAIGCPGAPPVFEHPIDWLVTGMFGDSGFCDCTAQYTALECLSGSHAQNYAGTDFTQTPYCDLAVDDRGAACSGGSVPVLDRFADFLPPAPTTCPISIAWQAGSVAVSLRDAGTSAEDLTTTDCGAELVFRAAGPPIGPVTPTGAFGWAIFAIGDRLVPFHIHPLADRGCDQDPVVTCSFE